MSKPTQGWDSCPPGELTRLAETLSFRRRVQAATTAAIILLAAAGVAGTAWLAHGALNSTSTNPSGDPCIEEPAAPCDPAKDGTQVVP